MNIMSKVKHCHRVKRFEQHFYVNTELNIYYIFKIYLGLEDN